MKTITVEDEQAGKRLDKALAELFPHYSRSALEKLIKEGQVLVNKSFVKSKYSLKLGDEISLQFEQLDKPIEPIKLPVVYEDDDVVVIQKPVGVLAHSKGAFNKEGTVASWLKNHVKAATTDFWESNRAGIVHRLDRGTSGIMICAKTLRAQSHLQKQFAKRNVKKTYLAVVAGVLPDAEGSIDLPIERNPKKPATFRVGVNGKPAQTDFKVLKTDGAHSLVELKPKTGRTHQLRVHLAYLKHPIVGDEFYNGESSSRLLLHAKELEITLPNSERKTFTAEIPQVFKDIFND